MFRKSTFQKSAFKKSGLLLGLLVGVPLVAQAHSLFTSAGAAALKTQPPAATAVVVQVSPLTATKSPIPIPAGLSASPSTLAGGQSSQLTVSLSMAGDADQTVNVTTDQPGLFSSIPASVTVPAGATSATFSVTTTTVTSTSTANISASLNGSASSTALTITP